MLIQPLKADRSCFTSTRLIKAAIVLGAILAALIAPSRSSAKIFVGQNSGIGSSPAARLSFDVASIRQNTAGLDASGANKPRSNFPLGSDNSYVPTGEFSATNLPLISYIIFAYKITTNNRDALIASVPAWVLDDGYNIEARTDMEGVTKDQMRLMMESLLAERFKLAVHHEQREAPVFAAVLDHSGQLGPQLRKHVPNAACIQSNTIQTSGSGTAAPVISGTDATGFPNVCNGFANSMRTEAPYHRRVGGGNVTLATIVSSFTGLGHLRRPVVDQTGLTGGYDFFLDYLPDSPPGKESPADASGPDFVNAVKSQLGIQLVKDKATMDFVIVDHVERPSPN